MALFVYSCYPHSQENEKPTLKVYTAWSSVLRGHIYCKYWYNDQHSTELKKLTSLFRMKIYYCTGHWLDVKGTLEWNRKFILIWKNLFNISDAFILIESVDVKAQDFYENLFLNRNSLTWRNQLVKKIIRY